jgi:rod shape-determining protein MreC
MSMITVTRRTIRREWTIFGVLLMLSVGLMGVSGTRTAHDIESSVNFALSPIETVINNAADTAGSYVSALAQIDHLRTDNERLRQQNLTLQEQLDRAAAISHLNDDWTKITQAAASVPYQTTPARVIVRDISDIQSRTLILDKGSNDGLLAGEVVIDAGGAVVGRITTVDATVSTVLLISDPSAVVVGKEAKTGATGTITGQVSGHLLMKYVDATAQLAKGDPVVTAGETLPGTNDRSPYPPGLLIGDIVDVSTDPNAVVKSADIVPAAHLSDATFVLIIVDYQGGFGAPVPSASPGASALPSGASSAKPPVKATPKPTARPVAQPTPSY